MGRGGIFRRSAEPWTMGRQTKWGAAETGEPRGTPTGGQYPSNAPFSRFFVISILSFSPPPFRNTQRFGGFETPGIGWWAEYRGEEKGHRAQWAAAELGGYPRNHGQWEDRQNGPPRKLAEAHRT